MGLVLILRIEINYSILGLVGNCKSTKRISIAVVDANAVIKGGQSLTNFADDFVTVPQVLSSTPKGCSSADSNCKVKEITWQEIQRDSNALNNGEDDDIEVEAEAGDTFEASSMADDGSSEQSWSLSESNVVCITGDYAMQNVILQMGLRLLAPGDENFISEYQTMCS
ncbi:unnamed protein product [Arabidopsis lyrata]|nr:unnamed protein product [Arabidopsis lyrata]